MALITSHHPIPACNHARSSCHPPGNELPGHRVRLANGFVGGRGVARACLVGLFQHIPQAATSDASFASVAEQYAGHNSLVTKLLLPCCECSSVFRSWHSTSLTARSPKERAGQSAICLPHSNPAVIHIDRPASYNTERVN
ncbi:uncharacterized protein TERG_12177 [Trichophyton rubrum CBS 118892]|uniref:Uncharacterized protein n=1 Tax=Trichophyton rubrum (strain ATCC MYA-4607 / CBS 118892) TaxID=559305 RepID=A0A080WUD5_TRIRC|nr:uncharacterized protein TERG_12177 [Trichophyton rubrum CBS 118892]KFL61708.1 hypothetical protein TERG_12177 [Trichophyton rubrum CBS 118892]